MKRKILYLTLALILVSGCGKKQEDIQESTPVSVQTNIEIATMEQKGQSADATAEAVREYIANNLPENEDDISDDYMANIQDYLKSLAGGNVALGESYIKADSIILYEDLKQISYEDATGIPCYVDLGDDEYEKEEAALGESATSKDTFYETINMWELYNTNEDHSYKPTEKDLASKTNSTENRVLILAGLTIDESSLSSNISESVNEFTGLVDVLKKEGINCNIDVLPMTYENLANIDASQYEMIAILSHGCKRKFNGKTVQCLRFIQDVHDSNFYDSISQINTLAGEPILHKDVKHNAFGVTPAFFSYFYGGDGFEDTIIHLGACYSAGDDAVTDDDKLADTLTQKCGASAVLGNYGTIKTKYNNAKLQIELEMLYCGYSFIEAEEMSNSLIGANDSNYRVFLPFKEEKPAFCKIFYDGGISPHDVRFKYRDELSIYRVTGDSNNFFVDAIRYDYSFSKEDMEKLKSTGSLSIQGIYYEDGFSSEYEDTFTYDYTDDDGTIIAALDNDFDYEFRFILQDDGTYRTYGGSNGDDYPRRTESKLYTVSDKAMLSLEVYDTEKETFYTMSINLKDYLQGKVNVGSSVEMNDTWNIPDNGYTEKHLWGEAIIGGDNRILGFRRYYEY